MVINRAFWGEQALYCQYPGNWNSIMIVNLSVYIFYILALVLPPGRLVGQRHHAVQSVLAAGTRL